MPTPTMPRVPHHKQVYSSRRANTNPRTGEGLRPWEEVQVSDPATPPLSVYFVGVEIQTVAGPEFRQFRVRAPPSIEHTAELEWLAVTFVKKLGFVTTGLAKHE